MAKTIYQDTLDKLIAGARAGNAAWSDVDDAARANGTIPVSYDASGMPTGYLTGAGGWLNGASIPVVDGKVLFSGLQGAGLIIAADSNGKKWKVDNATGAISPYEGESAYDAPAYAAKPTEVPYADISWPAAPAPAATPAATTPPTATPAATTTPAAKTQPSGSQAPATTTPPATTPQTTTPATTPAAAAPAYTPPQASTAASDGKLADIQGYGSFSYGNEGAYRDALGRTQNYGEFQYSRSPDYQGAIDRAMGYGPYSYGKEGELQGAIGSAMNYGPFQYSRDRAYQGAVERATNNAPYSYGKEGDLQKETDKAMNYGPFQYSRDPEYQQTMGKVTDYGPYSYSREGDLQRATDRAMERDPFQYSREPDYRGALDKALDYGEFSYDPETDPVYSSYRKTYAREGRRASEDALGQYAAMTGGAPSTAAMAAAQQAGNYYSAQMADKIPELYQQAYNRYLQGYQRQLQALDALNADRSFEYGQYSDEQNRRLQDVDLLRQERDFDYNQYLQRYQQQLQALDAMNADRNTEYGQYADAYNRQLQNVNLLRQDRDFDYNRYLQDYQQRLNDVDVLGADRNFEYGQYGDEYKRKLQNVDLLRQDQEADYNRYLQDYQQRLNDVDMLSADRDFEYGRYGDEYKRRLQALDALNADRGFEYGRYGDDYNRLLSQYEAQRDREDTDYNRAVYADETAYQREQDRLNRERQSMLDQYNMGQGEFAQKVYAYSPDGTSYDIGSEKGQAFIASAAPGQTMTGGDGSIWRKNEDGSVTINHKGKTYTIAGQTAEPAPASGYRNSGGGNTSRDTGNTGNETGDTGDIFKTLMDSGYTNLGQVVYALGQMGIPQQNAQTIASSYMEWLKQNGTEEEAPQAQGAAYNNLAETLDRMVAGGRSRNELYTEIDGEVRDGAITKEQGEALKEKYYALADNIANSGQTHTGGKPQAMGFNSTMRQAEHMASMGSDQASMGALADFLLNAHNAGKIHEYEIDIILDRLGIR